MLQRKHDLQPQHVQHLQVAASQDCQCCSHADAAQPAGRPIHCSQASDLSSALLATEVRVQTCCSLLSPAQVLAVAGKPYGRKQQVFTCCEVCAVMAQIAGCAALCSAHSGDTFVTTPIAAGGRHA